ncbi:MAG: mechanosensitive ion channel family protein [Firmicutes bacterium]|nr:mechanosensitive ion channel family protein [Bacillota bacterium]
MSAVTHAFASLAGVVPSLAACSAGGRVAACLGALGLEAGAALLQAAAVILAGHILARLLGAVLDRFLDHTRASGLPGFDETRAATVRGLMKSLLRYAIDFLVLVTVLAGWGVPVSGLLAGAGIAGLAVGFGAQNLVRDVITGFFLLFEDQFRVGEHVELAGVSGVVEDIGFRITRVRDFGGQLHMVPNGQIERVTNYSRGSMRLLVTVRVDYNEDLDHVEQVLNEVCERFRRTWTTLTEGPQLLGVQEIRDAAVEYLVWGRAQPGEQWAAERALRREIKKALDAAGIRAPYPQRVAVVSEEAAAPAPAAPAAAAAGAAPAPAAQGTAPAAADAEALRRTAERARSGEAGPPEPGEPPPSERQASAGTGEAADAERRKEG